MGIMVSLQVPRLDMAPGTLVLTANTCDDKTNLNERDAYLREPTPTPREWTQKRPRSLAIPDVHVLVRFPSLFLRRHVSGQITTMARRRTWTYRLEDLVALEARHQTLIIDDTWGQSNASVAVL